MLYIWLTFLIITFLLSIKRTSWGCCCLLLSRILIPECVRLTPIIDISLNTCVIAILLLASFRDVLFLKCDEYKDDYLRVLSIFMAFFLIMLPLSDTIDTNLQFKSWFQFLLTNILPAFIFVIGIRTKEDLIIILKALLIVCIINCMYGCFTISIGFNPYTFLINQLYSTRIEQISEISSELNTRGGVLITSSTFEHANGWGYFLPITFVLFYYIYDNWGYIINKNAIIVVLILLSISVLICGKRSAYVSYMAFWGVFLFLGHRIKIKYIIFILLGIVVVFFVIALFPQFVKFQNILESSLFFWDDKLVEKNDVGGSTMELRINQFFYPWVEINNNILFGHGFGWTGTFLRETGNIHPILYGFESIFSQVICEGGIIGSILWVWLFFKSYKYSIIHYDSHLWPLLFTFTQIMIVVATGLSYFVFYGIYIVILNKFKLLDD